MLAGPEIRRDGRAAPPRSLARQSLHEQRVAATHDGELPRLARGPRAELVRELRGFELGEGTEGQGCAAAFAVKRGDAGCGACVLVDAGGREDQQLPAPLFEPEQEMTKEIHRRRIRRVQVLDEHHGCRIRRELEYQTGE